MQGAVMATAVASPPSFDVKLPTSRPLAIGELTKDQLDAEIQAGMDDIYAGRVVSVDQVAAEMRGKYGE